MNRLFVNLYLVIMLGLLSINWLSEQLWQQFIESEHSQSQQLHPLEQVAKILPLLQGQKSQSKESIISKLSKSLDIQIKTAPMNDFYWLEEQKEKLMSGQVLRNYDEQDNVIFYVKFLESATIYQLGPFNRNVPSETPYQHLKWLFLLASYLLLGGVIGLWTRPLWRDLKQLNNMASEIANGKLDVAVYANKHSPIQQIVITFKDMAHRIIRLLSDQKQLVNAVSHELRTPLSRLRFSLVMLEGANEEQRKDMVQDVSEIEALIDEMLSYARLENINQDIKKSSVDLTSLITNQIDKLVRLSHLTIKWQKPEPCFYHCNEHLIERAIQNLSTNALRYAKGCVEISLVMTQSHVKIIIEDDGHGIDEKNRDKIFEPFFRLESHRNRDENQQKGGYGLGLAIVQRICEWHKASCTLSTSTLGGCKFIIDLPIDEIVERAIRKNKQ
ncbi:MAG: ATP-binding protein [Colwellia sp.]|nr:ATP-binding protein [Colwellia sp.]